MWQASIDNVVFPNRHISSTCSPATPSCSLKLIYLNDNKLKTMFVSRPGANVCFSLISLCFDSKFHVTDTLINLVNLMFQFALPAFI